MASGKCFFLLDSMHSDVSDVASKFVAFAEKYRKLGSLVDFDDGITQIDPMMTEALGFGGLALKRAIVASECYRHNYLHSTGQDGTPTTRHLDEIEKADLAITLGRLSALDIAALNFLKDLSVMTPPAKRRTFSTLGNRTRAIAEDPVRNEQIEEFKSLMSQFRQSEGIQDLFDHLAEIKTGVARR